MTQSWTKSERYSTRFLLLWGTLVVIDYLEFVSKLLQLING
jgi:hypothetical protein